MRVEAAAFEVVEAARGGFFKMNRLWFLVFGRSGVGWGVVQGSRLTAKPQ